MLSPELTSARLRLRPYRAEDEADFVALFSQPGVLEHSSTSADPEHSRQLFIKAQTFLTQPPDKPFQLWKLTRQGKMVGHAELKWTDSCEEHELEVVYFLHPDSWGQGLGTEVCQALVAHAQKQGARAVIATVNPQHQASMNVLEKSGFYETELRQDAEGVYWLFRARFVSL